MLAGLAAASKPERVGVLAFDAEHVPVHDHGVAAAQGLRDVGLLALLQGDPLADRDDGRLDIALKVTGSSLLILSTNEI